MDRYISVPTELRTVRDTRARRGIGMSQIDEAIINESTILPDYLDDEMDGEDFLIQL